MEAGWLLVCCIHVSEEGKSSAVPESLKNYSDVTDTWLGYPFSIVVVVVDGILNLSQLLP